MYLARFDTDAGAWLQGIAVIPAAPSPARNPGWWDGLERVLGEALLVPAVTTSRRIALGEDGVLRQLVSLLAPVERERDVRRLLAGLTRLELVAEGSVILPQGRQEHDEWAGEMPVWRWSTVAEEFSAGGVRLGVDLRVLPALGRLMEAALSERARLAYQLIVKPVAADPEASRSARRQVLALEEMAGAGEALIGSQEWLARQLANPHLLVQEIVAVEEPAKVASLILLMRDLCRARSPELASIRPEGRFVAGAFDEAVALGVHAHDLHPLEGLELAGISAGEGERDGLVRWRPLHLPPAAFATASSTVAHEEPALDVGDLPAPASGDPPYVFVSYKREDLARAAPLLRRLAASGVRLWYDRGIPGGAEWDAVIESRLEGAAVVLLFATSAAMRSKYVRREVKFADAIDRPILCVALEEPELVQGMRMLLTQYQILDARAPDCTERLLGALAHLHALPGLRVTPV